MRRSEDICLNSRIMCRRSDGGQLEELCPRIEGSIWAPDPEEDDCAYILALIKGYGRGSWLLR